VAKVWIVNSCTCPSDDTIDGAFSSQEKARAFIEATGAQKPMNRDGSLTHFWRNGEWDYFITEYEIDEFQVDAP